MLKALIKNILHNITRRLYWLYRLSKARKGKNLNITFPVKVEGKGQITIGSNTTLHHNVKLAAGQGSKITIGNNCRLEEDVEIITGNGAEIILGNNCWLMKGTVIRAYNHKFEIGDNVVMSTFVQIFSREKDHEGNLTIGNGTHINDYAMLDVTGDLEIGRQVAVGQFAVIFTHDHLYNDKDKPAWKGGVVTGKISVADWAWIGARVTVMHGVKIGYRTVVASGGVVTKDLDDNTIYGGIPAKELKQI
jgi:acetyltransferase-like isoleucine patch superfamily enzyme